MKNVFNLAVFRQGKQFHLFLKSCSSNAFSFACFKDTDDNSLIVINILFQSLNIKRISMLGPTLFGYFS